MNEQHTPEPWRKEGDWRTGMIVGAYGSDVAVTVGKYGEANAARITACVNACAGIPTDDLVDHGVGGLKEWIDEADETLKAVCASLIDVPYLGRCEQGIYALKKQRDDLLSTAIKVRNDMRRHGYAHADLDKTITKAGAA